MRHPTQPLEEDSDGILRFKENNIVRWMLDNTVLARGLLPTDMNALAMHDFKQNDREQFAQLIGYSLCGYNDLSYVSNESHSTAEAMLENNNDPLKAENETLRNELNELRQRVKEMAVISFNIHADDLT